MRIHQADGSLYQFPAGGDEEALVMLSDMLPTGFECGVLYSPAAVLMIDLDDKRLATAKIFGATSVVSSTDGQAAQHVMELTEGAGVDLAIEAVGLPASFEVCQAIVQQVVGSRMLGDTANPWSFR